MDEGTYAIARWGVERAAAQGVAVCTFPHHDAAAARALIEGDAQGRSRPVILTDGFCPLCGESAPIASLLQIVERHGGQLVLDDTQAFGMLGEKPCAATPFGLGGGGSLKWHGGSSPHAIAGSSLAKAFGVPIAVLAGSEALIGRFEQRSETRLHCSPPSLAALRAAEHALAMNRVQATAAGSMCRGSSRAFALSCARSVSRRRVGSFPSRLSMRAIASTPALCTCGCFVAGYAPSCFAAVAASKRAWAFSSTRCTVRRTSIAPSKRSMLQ